MAPKKSRNPIGFTSIPVSIVTVLSYVALAVSILYVHLYEPIAPDTATPVKGVNITEAWHDLQTITTNFHPYNSRASDVVHKWLLTRIDEILNNNNASRVLEGQSAAKSNSNAAPEHAPFVTVFDDRTSNLTYSGNTLGGELSVYFEATNIMVYIRGSQDGNTDWWRDPHAASDDNKRGVLVNAHYDSVSTGYGATDNGVGVISVLQLIKYYSTPGNAPKRGFVALLNNGEEDFLNGANAFLKHPLSRFPDTFLNLEGAGAGGRALLLRSTDVAITQAYSKSSQPFGTVAVADAFNNRVIRSETDYVVLNGRLGLRGLDVSFYHPRARYHTNQDSTVWTNKGSLWNMLSTAIATTEELTSDTESTWAPKDGHPGVWFDLFGRAFGLLDLHTLFAISVTLLVVAPIVMIAIVAILAKVDRYYLFARKAKSDPLDPRAPDEEIVIQLHGWRGLFRYPLAFIAASAAVGSLTLLVVKFNPYIVYSSPFTVWSTMLSAWFIVAWFFLRGADFMRPTALHRAHALGWLFVLAWIVLVAATVGENNFHIGSGYFIVIYFAAIFVALLISYLEMFGLPRKAEYVQLASRSANASRPLSAGHGVTPSIRSGRVHSPNDGPSSSGGTRNAVDDPSETTSLLSKRRNKVSRYRDDEDYDEDEEDDPLPRGKAHGDEQKWSATLPSWLWLLQFLILGPITIIIVGELGLFAVFGAHQTLADGNKVLPVYLTIAIFSVLLLIPVSPFLHRFTSRLPIILLFVFAGTLAYSLLSFPFTPENRLKLYFGQDVDLSNGHNKVALVGLDGYVQDAISYIPSTSGQEVNCTSSTGRSKDGLVACRWSGLAPNVVTSIPSTYAGSKIHQPRQAQYNAWISVNATRLNTTDNEAVFRIAGQNTRACKLVFDTPITDFDVDGAAPQDDDRFYKVPKAGTNQINLWHREWNKPWTVRVKWDTDRRSRPTSPERKSLEGRAVCLWSDANVPGVIPALDEIKQFLPAWATVSKLQDGLVEGHKSFKV